MNAKEFFAALFDLAFERFVTIQLTGLVYALALAVGGIYALFAVVGAFEASAGLGVLTLLVLAPLGFLLCAVAVRVGLGALVSLIRSAENTREIRDALRKEKA